ncbi:MAG TPA: hypothetical protein VLM85_15135, partial [Polyangiaceae bacterium]|nr:hypothetical protein [Polyangiaceae bacterium]
MKRLLAGLWFSAVLALIAVSCGGDNGTTTDGGGGGPDGTVSNDGSPNDTGPTFPDGGCTPRTCTELGYDCGINPDGCGGTVNCGQCNAPAYCGGGGFSKCGTSSDGAVCTPTTCQKLGYDCGPAGDGCGGLLSCGTCTTPQTCGGGGKASVCGSSCINLCNQQVKCDGGGSTTLTGRIVAGTLSTYGTPDPVPNVLVYVPNGTVQAFTKGVQCNQCGADVSGSPLVMTNTAVDGTFSLSNVPVGSNIPVVIQLGRWRRQLTFNVSACTTQALGDIHMPRNKSEGDIPFTAISTGNLDAIECVLLKMGVAQAEFTLPGGGGRIEMYNGNGAIVGANDPPETSLMGSATVLDAYDQTFLPCWGSEVLKPAAELSNLVTYANNGGRVFATHYSYTWLFQNPPFSSTAVWAVNTAGYSTVTSTIITSFSKGQTFAQWMQLVGGLINVSPPEMTITSPRYDFSSVASPAIEWMYANAGTAKPGPANPQFPLHYTFDTPWQQPSTCGRVIFSDFHVANAGSAGLTFPAECTAGPMTPQEKALEYMIWDLASCVPPPPSPSCTPLTCAQQNVQCGPAGDGCGNLLNCGPCVAPQTCGGG